MPAIEKKHIIIAGIILAVVAATVLITIAVKDYNSFEYTSDQGIETFKAATGKSGTPDSDSKIKVHVKGAVANPGVCELSAEARVEEALKMAGGATEESDLTSVNLAKRLEDEDEVFIPFITVPDAEGENKAHAADNGLVNINSATVEQLQKLPGIGETYAQAIVSYREANGKFKSIENIKRVSGIGTGRYNAIKDLICV